MSRVQLSLSESKILTMMSGDTDSPVYATSTSSKRGKQIWMMEEQSDGTAVLLNSLYHKYAGVTTALHPNVTVVVTDSAIHFTMESVGERTFKIYVKNGAEKLYLYLAPDWSHSPKVALVREEDAKDAWHLKPIE